MTSTQRSLAALRELGYLFEIVVSVPNVDAYAECRCLCRMSVPNVVLRVCSEVGSNSVHVCIFLHTLILKVKNDANATQFENSTGTRLPGRGRGKVELVYANP